MRSNGPLHQVLVRPKSHKTALPPSSINTLSWKKVPWKKCRKWSTNWRYLQLWGLHERFFVSGDIRDPARRDGTALQASDTSEERTRNDVLSVTDYIPGAFEHSPEHFHSSRMASQWRVGHPTRLLQRILNITKHISNSSLPYHSEYVT
jgi:hypothetical protein